MLSHVEVTEEVVLAAMTHALSTEGEEIMGLLLGDVWQDEQPGGTSVSRIWMAYPQIRTDRRKDRVETSPEQMARCVAHAERLSLETGLRTRVVGWYHSHPHITVLPSHVDCRTQSMYQLMDPGFVGLIFSVFNSDSNSKLGRVQITAFQSVPAGSVAAAHELGEMGGLDGFSSLELDSQGLDAATKQALRMSAAASHDVSPNSVVRREVPLTVVPARTPVERSLHDYTTVQRVLAMEEKEAFSKALAQLKASQPSSQQTSSAQAGAGKSPTRPLSVPSPPVAAGAALGQLYAATCYQQGLLQLIEASSAALTGIHLRCSEQAVQVKQLQHRNATLREALAAVKAERPCVVPV
mmetsp:Transcript_21353/g.36368  ORF Transcript_21353/g.36368 Transcript_21353/m.36368 type:complete len:353 (+) Transcript_21353:134-1192(+)